MAQKTKLTAEGLAFIGKEYPPVTGQATLQDIRKFAVATDWIRPEYFDDAVSDRPLEAPPMFYSIPTRPVVPLSQLTPDGVLEWQRPPLAVSRGMAGGVEVEFAAPIRVGDQITARKQIIDIYEKQGRSDLLVFVITETRFTNQQDELVAVERHTSILI